MSFLFEKLTREGCEAIREADGFDKGYERGEADGFERGEAAGFERGESSSALKIASAMKSRGMTIGEICEITGLKPEQIEAL